MSPADRRAAIVQATLPLLAEHGANVTTRQIAHAADIAEGTVFRVFADKEALVHTCVHEAFRTDDLAAEIRGISTGLDLHDRLNDAAALFLEHFSRLGILMNALATSGYDVRKGAGKPDADDGKPHGGPAEFVREPLAAAIEILEPDRQLFRIDLEHVVQMLFGLLFSLQLAPETYQCDTRGIAAERVEVLLHGAMKH